MGTVRDLGLLMLRVGVGASCFSHGAQKLFGWFGGGGVEETADAKDTMGFEPGERSAPVGRSAGDGRRGDAGSRAGHRAGRRGPDRQHDCGQLGARPERLRQHRRRIRAAGDVRLVGSTFALTGPGRFSIDYATGEVFNRPWMRVVALVGALATAAYLVSTRSAVVAESDDSEE